MNCLECGACCRVFGLVEVLENDNVNEDLTVPTELGYRVMKTVDFRCVCLCDDNRCLIYPTRPTICRRFEVSGSLCKMAIEHEQKHHPKSRVAT